MGDVNWWLMALAFVLGSLLTFVFTIRRGKREVPVYATSGAAAKTTGAAKLTDAKTAEVEEEPYGTGSLRVAPSASAPSGYPVKGNEDSMLYHTPESPSYKQKIAEIWFRDEETAQKAGFTRWDKNST